MKTTTLPNNGTLSPVCFVEHIGDSSITINHVAYAIGVTAEEAGLLGECYCRIEPGGCVTTAAGFDINPIVSEIAPPNYAIHPVERWSDPIEQSFDLVMCASPGGRSLSAVDSTGPSIGIDVPADCLFEVDEQKSGLELRVRKSCESKAWEKFPSFGHAEVSGSPSRRKDASSSRTPVRGEVCSSTYLDDRRVFSTDPAGGPVLRQDMSVLSDTDTAFGAHCTHNARELSHEHRQQ